MKRWGILIILLIAIFMVGCGGQKTASPVVPAGRDISTPSKALLGHWQLGNATSGTTTDIYFDGQHHTWSHNYEGDITNTIYDYAIYSEDPKTDSVTIRLRDQGSVGFGEPLTISFNEAATKLNYPNEFTRLEYIYIDSKQSP